MKTEIIVFSDKYCLPCRKLKELLNKHKIEYTEINVEEKPEITCEYSIGALPTMILLEDGEIRKKVVGSINKAALDDFIKV